MTKLSKYLVVRLMWEEKFLACCTNGKFFALSYKIYTICEQLLNRQLKLACIIVKEPCGKLKESNWCTLRLVNCKYNQWI